MLAHVDFDQFTQMDVLLKHARMFKALKVLPFRWLHRTVLGLTWLDTWVRVPLATTRYKRRMSAMLEDIGLDGALPKGESGWRREFLGFALYLQHADIFTLLLHASDARFLSTAVRWEGMEILQEARKRSPVMFIGFRFGAYPALPWLLASLGPPLSMIIHSRRYAEIERSITETYVTPNVKFHAWGRESPFAFRRDSVAEREPILSVLDVIGSPGRARTTVRILDRDADIPYAAAYVAAATGRTIIPTIVTRAPGPVFTVRFGEPAQPAEVSRHAAQRALHRVFHQMERWLVQFPDQWIGWGTLARKPKLHQAG